MTKSVGIITFHASHNYGSMLQAYALQRVITDIGLNCEIINLRTVRQKAYYSVGGFHRGTSKGKIKRRILLTPFYYSLINKYIKFENFLRNDLILTSKEYTSLTELDNESFKYDYYISGSDQIWNTTCLDFDWAYYLPFVKKGKRIAYAPSMGPAAGDSVKSEYYDIITHYLNEYDALSVREDGAAGFIKRQFGLEASVNLDPTLLLESEKWEEIISKEPLVRGDYIFVYTPFFNAEVFALADKISQKYKMKIVISQIYNDYIWESYKFSFLKSNVVVKTNVGPKEFLNLCKHARITCGGSFHLVVFSILLHTPFVVLDGLKDNRTLNLLEKLGLKQCSVTNKCNMECMPDPFKIDFGEVNIRLEALRDKSLLWLKNVLN